MERVLTLASASWGFRRLLEKEPAAAVCTMQTLSKPHLQTHKRFGLWFTVMMSCSHATSYICRMYVCKRCRIVHTPLPCEVYGGEALHISHIQC
jgi:hypothetical protein